METETFFKGGGAGIGLLFFEGGGEAGGGEDPPLPVIKEAWAQDGAGASGGRCLHWSVFPLFSEWTIRLHVCPRREQTERAERGPTERALL